MATLPRLVSTKQYAARHGLPWRTIQRLCREGRIKYAQKIGNWYVMPEDALIFVEDVSIPAYMFSRDESYAEPEYRTRGTKPFGESNTANLVRVPSLSRIRKAAGLSREALYERSGVAPRTQQLAEEGRKVRARTAVRLARALGCDPADLLARNT